MHATDDGDTYTTQMVGLGRPATYAEVVGALTAGLEAQGCTDVRVERKVAQQWSGKGIDRVTCVPPGSSARVGALELSVSRRSKRVYHVCQCAISAYRSGLQLLDTRMQDGALAHVSQWLRERGMTSPSVLHAEIGGRVDTDGGN